MVQRAHTNMRKHSPKAEPLDGNTQCASLDSALEPWGAPASLTSPSLACVGFLLSCSGAADGSGLSHSFLQREKGCLKLQNSMGKMKRLASPDQSRSHGVGLYL